MCPCCPRPAVKAALGVHTGLVKAAGAIKAVNQSETFRLISIHSLSSFRGLFCNSGSLSAWIVLWWKCTAIMRLQRVLSDECSRKFGLFSLTVHEKIHRLWWRIAIAFKRAGNRFCIDSSHFLCLKQYNIFFSA